MSATLVEVVDAETRLTTDETEQLAACERVIAAGMGTFVEVGHALLDIREFRLWIKYGTFEDYCRDRWGLSASQGHRMIQSATISQTLMDSGIDARDTPASERIALALAPILAERPDELANTWRAIVAEAGSTNAAVTGKLAERYIRREHRDLFKAGATYGRPAPMIELLSLLDDYIEIAEKLKRFSARNPNYQPPERVGQRFAVRLELIENLTEVARRIADGDPVPTAELDEVLDTRPLT